MKKISNFVYNATLNKLNLLLALWVIDKLVMIAILWWMK